MGLSRFTEPCILALKSKGMYYGEGRMEMDGTEGSQGGGGNGTLIEIHFVGHRGLYNHSETLLK